MDPREAHREPGRPAAAPGTDFLAEAAALGGQVGRDLGDVDWPATPLGDPRGWPPALRGVLRTLLSSRFAMWLAWGPELTFFCNDAYRRMTLAEKYPWALGRPAGEVWAEAWAEAGPRIESVTATGQATWDEGLLLFLQRSGFPEETYHTFSYGPVHDDDGAVTGMLCVVVEETERVIAQRRIDLMHGLTAPTAAAQSEADLLDHLRRHLAADRRSVPFALIYLADPDRSLRLAAAIGIEPGHPAAPRTLEPDTGGVWPAADAIHGDGLLVDDLSARFGALPTGDWDIPPTNAVVAPLPAHGGEPPAGVLVAALNPYRPADDGSRAFVTLIAGHVAAALAAARAYDSERRRAESLAELDEAKTAFFTNISHEFRSPLTLMLGPVQDALADASDPLPPVQQRRLELVRANAHRLRGLVDDLLEFTRIQEGRIEACYEPVDLGRYTAELAGMFRSAFEQAGLQLDVDCPRLDARTTGTPILVDRDMWAKIVLNLISNAFKFTFAGSVLVRVAAEDGDARAPAGWVRLEVADTGMGIPPADQARLFERFHRVHGARGRSHEGSGIGLALVAELAQLHGGGAEVASEPNAGTTVTVRIARGAAHLPAEQVQDDWGPGLDVDPSFGDVAAYAERMLSAATARLSDDVDPVPGPSHPGADAPSVPRPRSRVLIVDDHPDMREYVAGLLAPGLDVTTAADGTAALEAARADPPDLVLCDVMMPGLDGFGLLHELRADPRTALIPVIMLSAHAGEAATVRALTVGADDYLVKPFGAAELLARVHANLQLAQARSHESAWRQVLLSAIRDAMVVIDDAGRVVEANDAFRALVGHPLADLPVAPPHPWLPDSAAGGMDAARTGVFPGENGRVTIALRHATGRRIWAEVTYGSVRDPRQGRRLVVATARDVTARLRAADRQASTTRLTTRLAELDEIPALLVLGAVEIARAVGAVGSTAAVVDGAGRLRSPDPDAPAPDPPVGAALLRVAQAGDLELTSAGGDLVTACMLPVHADDLRAAVRLEFDPPRQLSAADRAHLMTLCGVVAHAVLQTRAYDLQRRVALTLQRSLLGPADLPPGFTAEYSPAVSPLEVGGDWYDVVELAEDRVGVVVGDCVGKGLDAATVMGQLRSACRALLLEANGPADALAALDHFAARTPHAACTTVFCAVIDQRTGMLTYASAGHPPGLLVHPDGRRELLDRAGGVPLASVTDPTRGQAIARLTLGSMLALYTDGLVERRGEHLDEGIDRLAATLTEQAAAGDADLPERILRGALPAGGQQDDVALLLYRHRNPTPFTAELTVDPGTLAPMRRALRHWLTEAGAPGADIDAVLVATGEACANAFEHGNGLDHGAQPVELSATIVAGHLDVTVRDHGRWRPPAARGNRGRGRLLMNRLMDHASIEGGSTGTVVRMRKELGRPVDSPAT